MSTPNLLIKKICYNCSNWNRIEGANTTIKREFTCTFFNQKVPLHGWCPNWEAHGKLITTTLLDKYKLEN